MAKPKKGRPKGPKLARLDIKVPSATKAGAKMLAKVNYQTLNNYVAQMLDERIAASRRGAA